MTNTHRWNVDRVHTYCERERGRVIYLQIDKLDEGISEEAYFSYLPTTYAGASVTLIHARSAAFLSSNVLSSFVMLPALESPLS